MTPQELEIAERLLESLATAFKPAKYRDHYRENLRVSIDAKTRGEELRLEAAHPTHGGVRDILDALKASLAAAIGDLARSGERRLSIQELTFVLDLL